MKKISFILALCVALTFLMSGCKPKEYKPVIAKEYGCFYFPGTDWGMSEDELFKALGKTADNFEEEKFGESQRQLTTEADFLGKSCKTSFFFTKNPLTDDEGISSVSVSYELGEKSFEQFKSELEELAESQGVEYIASEIKKRYNENGEEVAQQFNIQTVKNTDGLPQEMIDNANSYWRYAVENDLINLEEQGFSGEELEKEKERRMKWDFSKDFLCTPISSINVIYNCENNACIVMINGGDLLNVYLLSEKYLQLNS